jgi:hypothetical protein
MFIKCLLFLTLAIIAVQGRISKSRIESDAAEWTESHRKYMDQAPRAPFRGQMETKCRIMNECCPNKRDRFFDLMHTHKFEEVCIGNRVSPSSFKSRSSTCRREIQHLDNIKNSKEYAQFMRAISSMPKSDERFRKWRSQMAEVCSTDELESYYCEPDNMEKFQSCQEKVLRLVARENDGEGYDAYVREWKNDYRTYIQRLSKAFPNL